MPETTVYKDDRLPTRQDNVRISGQIRSMQSESESELVKEGAHLNFRVGIF